MKNKNWEQVTAAGDYVKLPPDWYVLVIKGVNDVPKSEYLQVVYDVAEGDYKGHYAKDEDWRRTTNWSYGDKAEGFFKSRLVALEESNPGFSIAKWQQESNERDFIGLIFGAAIQKRYYTNHQGEDKEALEVAKVVSADTAREYHESGEPLPTPRDTRAKVDTTASSSAFDDDVPFK